MRPRSLRLVCAATAALALASLTGTIRPITAARADDCLAKPDKSPPSGSHWFYRTDRATQRKCWYLADENTKTVQPTPKTSEQSTARATDQQQAADQGRDARPVADARAELIDRASSTEQSTEQSPSSAVSFGAEPAPTPSTTQPTVAPLASDPSPQASPQGWTAASRWPDPPNAPSNGYAPASGSAADATTPALNMLVATPSADAAAGSAVEVAPQPVQAVEAVNGTDAPSGPDYLLFALIALVVAFAVFLAFAIVRLLADRRAAAQDAQWYGTPEPPSRLQRVDSPRSFSDDIDEVERLLAATRR